MSQSFDSDRILSQREVCGYVGLSRTTIWRLVRKQLFPPPIKLSPNRIGWTRLAIAGWLESRSPPGDQR